MDFAVISNSAPIEYGGTSITVHFSYRFHNFERNKARDMHHLHALYRSVQENMLQIKV